MQIFVLFVAGAPKFPVIRTRAVALALERNPDFIALLDDERRRPEGPHLGLLFAALIMAVLETVSGAPVLAVTAGPCRIGRL